MVNFKVLSLLAALVLSPVAATAATIDFSSNGTGAAGTVDGGPLSYTSSATASLLGVSLSPVVVENTTGLGVTTINLNPEINSGLGYTETLTITFSWAVNLLDFTLASIASFDDFEIAFNGGAFTAFGPGLSNPYTGLGQNNVISFSIRASTGTPFFSESDSFVLASANVAPVPLPAAGLLLLTAVGAAAALRRRKAVTAA